MITIDVWGGVGEERQNYNRGRMLVSNILGWKGSSEGKKYCNFRASGHTQNSFDSVLREYFSRIVLCGQIIII